MQMVIRTVRSGVFSSRLLRPAQRVVLASQPLQPDVQVLDLNAECSRRHVSRPSVGGAGVPYCFREITDFGGTGEFPAVRRGMY